MDFILGALAALFCVFLVRLWSRSLRRARPTDYMGYYPHDHYSPPL